MSMDAAKKTPQTEIDARPEREGDEADFAALCTRCVYRGYLTPSNTDGNRETLSRDAFERFSIATKIAVRAELAIEHAAEPGNPACTHGLRSSKRLRLLVGRAQAWVERNVDDETLSVTKLAIALHTSRASLHRKFVLATGQTPGDFIREVRLQLAHRMLSEGDCNVSQAAYAVGFVSLSGFSRAYRARYGAPPSRHLHPSGNERAQARADRQGRRKARLDKTDGRPPAAATGRG